MNHKRWPEMVIGLMLLLSMGCAGLALYAGDRKAEHWGPRMLERAPSGEVWLVLDRELLIASPAGALRRRVPLSEMPGPVNALVALPGDENQIRMLTGAINLPAWLVMDGDGQVVERITPSGTDVPFYETFHLAAAPDGRIAMGTGGDHRVLLFDAKGKYLAQSEPGAFRFANGLWFENGQWWVVDTNHRQIRILNGETLKAEASVPVPAVDGARWPSLARRGKDGAITVTEMRTEMQYGVVFDMSGSGQVLRQFRSQAENPQPMDILWLDEQLLMADSDDFSLQLFDKKGRFLKRWGDDAISAALRTARDDSLWWSRTLLGAQTGAAILGLLALIGYFNWKRRAESVPEDSGDRAFRRLGTPCLSEKDAVVEQLKLFLPLILLVSGVVIFSQALILFAAPLAGGLKAMINASWFVPALWAGRVIFIAVIAWIAFSMYKLMRQRMQEPRFEAALSSRWVKWSKHSTAVREALEEGESVREILMVYTASPVFNVTVWALTNRRMLIFALGAGSRGKLLASIPRHHVSASIEATQGWFWWNGTFGKMSLRVADGRVFLGYPASPVTARRTVELLALSCGEPSAVPPGMAPKTARPVGLRSPRPIWAFLISLPLPGAAQMMQNRFATGLLLLTVALANIAFSLTPVLLGWIGHFYDVPLSSGLQPVLFAATWALLAAWDARNYARRVHGAAT